MAVKSRNVSYGIFCGDGGGGVEAECIGKQPLETPRRRVEHSNIIGHRKIICGDVTREVVYHLSLAARINLLLAANEAVVYEI